MYHGARNLRHLKLRIFILVLSTQTSRGRKCGVRRCRRMEKIATRLLRPVSENYVTKSMEAFLLAVCEDVVNPCQSCCINRV
ncbi:hypothetical protein F5146DRAFT_1034962 [Armillaria mellea]|nr:hypothetical protein F5146DRAFT_1034962 [Armillaria mellea]